MNDLILVVLHLVAYTLKKNVSVAGSILILIDSVIRLFEDSAIRASLRA